MAEIILPNGVPAFLVTRYRDVCTVLEDRRFSRTALSKAGAGQFVAYLPSEAVDPESADHSMPHRVVNRWFTPQGVERLRRRTQQVTDQLLLSIESCTPPIDLVAALANALPMTIIGELVGIPEADRQWVRERAPLVAVDSPTDESRMAEAAVFRYFEEQFEQRRVIRTDDVLGALLEAHEDNPGTLPIQKLAPLAMRLCLPGLHSVAATLGKAVPVLLRQPEIYAALRCRPELVEPVVEELLRLAPPVSTSLPRQTLTDVEISGVRIPGGSIVVASLESANFDPEQYSHPEFIVPERGDRRHTTFSLGSNYCFGAALSRMELQVVIGTLARRMPNLRLAVTEDELHFRAGVVAPDVLNLPVLW
ncbi:cytochrome P450 [Nocardia sp. JMUB6875]|uniref:cytochrome P450 n=1 Tax=Nocardia sp. JMUB6875 TaxID=3158170 RepID=UPI0034E8FEBC